jgi:hypothetical protein
MTKRERRRRAKFERRQLRKLARLGVSNFESIDKTQQRQTDLIERLEQAHIDSGYTAGFEDCSPLNRGKVKCSEGCAFGMRRRRLEMILPVHRLFTAVGEPYYEVWLSRTAWARPIKRLGDVSIPAAKKLIRRALDKIFSEVVAVGSFKLSRHLTPSGEWRWQPAVHLVVAGAEKEDLAKALSLVEHRRDRCDLYQVNKVKNLSELIGDILQCDLEGPRPPWLYSPKPTQKQKVRHYFWELRLPRNNRVIRYGCDRYFNRLKKRPRVARPKPAKRRPYPYWLAPCMFGSHPQNCKCVRCNGPHPLN